MQYQPKRNIETDLEGNPMDQTLDQCPHYWPVVPYWASSIHVRFTPSGRSWAITVTGKMDPESKMSGLSYRAYFPSNLPEQIAINKACWRVVDKFRLRYEGSVLVQKSRRLWTREVAKKVNAEFNAKYGEGWIYTNEDAQKELKDLLKR